MGFRDFVASWKGLILYVILWILFIFCGAVVYPWILDTFGRIMWIMPVFGLIILFYPFVMYITVLVDMIIRRAGALWIILWVIGLIPLLGLIIMILYFALGQKKEKKK